MSEAKHKLKKLVKMLTRIRGRHTELVTVYIPAGYSISDVVAQLKQEQGTAENIKSKSVRKNVVSSLEKIIRHLQLYKQTPEHGLALFAGNVSEREGVTDINLWAIEPPEAIKTKMYWCDQQFVLDPLESMVSEKEIYGIINLDKNEAEIAFLKGKKIESVYHAESIVPGKTRAGGQSSMRFSRIREGMLNDWLKQTAEAANKIFSEHSEVIGIIVSGPGPIKEMFLKENYMQTEIAKKIIGTVDTSYTGEHGLHETLQRGEDLLREAGVTKEKKLLQKFFEELQKPHGLVVYGLNEVMKALEAGAVDVVIVSENLPTVYASYQCACGISDKFVSETQKNKQICSDCNQQKKLTEEREIIEELEERVKNYGSRLEVVSNDTREGMQFEEFAGIGAMLRYNI